MLVHSGIHLKEIFFLSNFVSGLAIFANPRINAFWYPKTLSVLYTSLTVFNIVGHSLRPATLDRSGSTVPSSKRILRYSMCHFSNSHSSDLRKNDSFCMAVSTALTTSL